MNHELFIPIFIMLTAYMGVGIVLIYCIRIRKDVKNN